MMVNKLTSKRRQTRTKVCSMTQSKMDIEEVLVSYQAEVIYKSIFYCRGNACSGVVVRSIEQWLQKIWMH